MIDSVSKGTLVPLILRLALAAVFIYHGLEKVRGDGNRMGAAWMRSAPDPQPPGVQLAVSWGELIGGIAMAFGFLTRLAAIGIAIIMVGAMATVHWKHGFGMDKGGFEYNVVLLAICASVFLLGGGSLSADRMFRGRPRVPMVPK